VTIAEAWDVLEAAGAIARGYGFKCAPAITRRLLRIELKRGLVRRVVELVRRVVELSEDQLNACVTAAGVRDLVEREVARAVGGLGAVA
jgi:hypothetical protein